MGFCRGLLMATLARLLTAEEYALLSDNGQPTELVHGEVVDVNLPTPRHGEICVQTAYLLRRYLEGKPLGRVVGNDSGVVTERDPDTVRGADVAYYSFQRVPRGPLPKGYLSVVPELVFEVRSITDRWPNIHSKVAEYLQAGISVVCVLDEQTQAAWVFPADQPPQELKGDAELTLPDLLPDFRIPIRQFFE
jgi:Uma2 family endonuclease